MPIKCQNLRQLEGLAESFISPAEYQYIVAGAGDEQTLRDNLESFLRVRLDQRVLSGNAVNDIGTRILGSPLRMPVVIAAMAYHGYAHPSAEAETARGAEAFGTVLGVSTVSSQNLEHIAQSTDGDKWFQCYLTNDKGFNRELLQRASAAGYKAIAVTADVTVGGIRENDRRNNRSQPMPGNFLDADGNLRPIDFRFDNQLGPQCLDFVKANSNGLPLIVKGVTTAADARMALDYEVDAIQVSNHGGRQLDGAPAAFDSLPRVAEAVSGRVPIIFDSGVRRGADVFKALAAGADVVALGRPILYALAISGWQGVNWVLERIEEELRVVMQLTGATTLAQIRSTPLLR